MTHRYKLLLAALIVVCAAVYLIGNGSVSLWDRDEPRFAQTSRQMLQSGDWVVPRFLDKDRTAKPAMIYWLQASAMEVFGDNAFAARFPSAVAITLLLIVLAVVLWKPLGAETTTWTVFIFATSGLVITAAKLSITDAVLLLWVTIAQLCLYAMWRGNRSWPIVITISVAIGLAGLTKGPVILGMQGMTLVVVGLFASMDWFARKRSAGREQRGFEVSTNRDTGFQPVPEIHIPEKVVDTDSPSHGLEARVTIGILKIAVAILIVIAIVLPWVLMVNHRASAAFNGSVLKHEVWDRMMTPLEQHAGPPGYYFLTIWVTYFPWSLLLPLAIGLAIHRRADPRARFALAAIIGPWILLECVKTKLPHYFLPVFPPLAFLTADALVRVIHRQINDLRSTLFVSVVGVWALIVAAAAFGPWIVARVPDIQLPWTAMKIVSAYGVSFAAIVFTLFFFRKIAAAAIAMGLGTLGLVALLYSIYLPRAAFLRVSPEVAAILIDHGVTHPHQVIMMDYMEPSLAFAQGGTIREAGELGFTKRFEPRFTPWLVVTKKIWDKAPAGLRSDFAIVGEVHGLAYADRGRWVTVMVLHHHK
jgi:4-amino-4-deoxy-L-arabinose transferase-like glycosyltransferase